METNNDDPNQIDFAKVPIVALQKPALALLSSSLNPSKILPSEDGFPRDWRGIAHLAGLQSLYGPAIHTDSDPMKMVLTLWCKEADIQTATFDNLIKFLGVIDRWDVADDLAEFLVQDAKTYKDSKHHKQMINVDRQDLEDNLSPVEFHTPDSNILTNDDVFRAKQGLPPQIYDAFLLFADEDIEFATEVVERLEENHPKFSFKLCLKNRDLLGGIMFEHEAIMRLISERCNRLIVIVSPAFLKSSANEFFVSFAQALAIEEKRRKIIPCLYEYCNLPKPLSFYFHLKYYQSGKLFNFWDKLSDSIRSTNVAAIENSPQEISIPRIQISEIPEPCTQLANLQIQPSLPISNETKPIKQPRKKGTKITNVDSKKVHSMAEPKIRSAFAMIQLNAQSPNDGAQNGMSLQLANCDMTHSEANLSENSKPNKSGWLKKFMSSSSGRKKRNSPVMETSTVSCEIKPKTKGKNWLKNKLTSSAV